MNEVSIYRQQGHGYYEAAQRRIFGDQPIRLTQRQHGTHLLPGDTE
jgi:hypothetical protein